MCGLTWRSALISTPSPHPATSLLPPLLFFFVSGLLHRLIGFLTRQGRPSSPARSGIYVREIPGSFALQRQLQQLFHLHDSGLDQCSIDALLVFLYREVVGPKEPSDCVICLCEFTEEDKPRLLPACSHAFHINCIDTWLLSNSTCPLCRESLFVPGRAIENPVFDSEEWREEEGMPPVDGEAGHPSPAGLKAVEVVEGRGIEKRVFSVRLGKFRSLNSGGGNADRAGGDGAVPPAPAVRTLRQGGGGRSGGEGEADGGTLQRRGPQAEGGEIGSGGGKEIRRRGEGKRVYGKMAYETRLLLYFWRSVIPRKAAW